MKIAVIGATGFVGKSIVAELKERGHELIGICRTPEKAHEGMISVDVNATEELAEALKETDVVVSAFNPGWGNPNIYEDFLKGAKSIQEAVKKAGVSRFIVIGGAGSLYVAEGVQLIDTPEFPKEIYAGASAARDYLELIKQETELDWAFFSPAIEMHPGIQIGRTGNYRLGKDNPVFDQDGRSLFSVEDVAVVIADEIENPKHHKERFTAAY